MILTKHTMNIRARPGNEGGEIFKLCKWYQITKRIKIRNRRQISHLILSKSKRFSQLLSPYKKCSLMISVQIEVNQLAEVRLRQNLAMISYALFPFFQSISFTLDALYFSNKYDENLIFRNIRQIRQNLIVIHL